MILIHAVIPTGLYYDTYYYLANGGIQNF